MSRYSLLPWMAALSSMAALGASAQSAAPAERAPRAQAAPYRSTLERYQPFADEKVLPWKQSNETVDKIGGWRAYAKEAQDAAAADDQAPAGRPASPASAARNKGQP